MATSAAVSASAGHAAPVTNASGALTSQPGARHILLTKVPRSAPSASEQPRLRSAACRSPAVRQTTERTRAKQVPSAQRSALSGPGWTGSTATTTALPNNQPALRALRPSFAVIQRPKRPHVRSGKLLPICIAPFVPHKTKRCQTRGLRSTRVTQASQSRRSKRARSVAESVKRSRPPAGSVHLPEGRQKRALATGSSGA